MLGHHRLVARDVQGRFVLSPCLGELASAVDKDHFLASANLVLIALRDHIGESTQPLRRQGDQRVCVAMAERTIELCGLIPISVTLSMRAGSTAQVLLAWEEPDRLHRGLYGVNFTATNLSAARRCGQVQSVPKHEIGVVSIPALVRRLSGRVIVAVPIFGPVRHMGHQPGYQHVTTVVIMA